MADDWADWSTEMVRDAIEAHEEQEAQADYDARDACDSEATPTREDDEPEAEPPRVAERRTGSRMLHRDLWRRLAGQPGENDR